MNPRPAKLLGSTLLSGMPITDYKEKQIGVLVFSTNMAEQQGIMSQAGVILMAAFLTLLIVPLCMTFFVLTIAVLRPVQSIRQDNPGNRRRQGRSGSSAAVFIQ